MGDSYDVFICHASEDKARFVEPLVAALAGQGLTVWYDRFEIGLCDDFRSKMNEGLRGSRFGVVVVSPYSFKYWPQAELSALFNQEAHQKTRRVLPVRCDLTVAELTDRDPLLAGRRSIGWEEGVDAIARQIAAVVHQVRQAPVARSPVYNVPRRRAQTFVGRDLDLERLNAALHKGGPIAVSASIEGLAGVGKTELALQMVDRLSATDRFPGGIFWLDAETPDLTPTWGSAVADALAIGAGPVAERAKAAVRVVASGGPALLVLDNVTSWTAATTPGPLPTGAHVGVLVTTREQKLGGPQAFTHLAIECLAPAPARALLLTVAGRDLDRETGVDDLLGHLDGHALAIELAGAFLAAFPETSPAAYLARLRAGEPVEARVSGQVRYERTVGQALDTIWERLDVSAREAWQVAGEFAHAEASLELLAACGVDEDARRALRKFHLLTSSSDRWNMHRLVRDYGQRVGDADERAHAARRFMNGCVARSRAIDLNTGFRIYVADRAHFERALEIAGVVLGSAPDVHGLLLDRVGTGAQSAGDLGRAKLLLEQALAFALGTLSDDDPGVATRRANLAGVLRDVGDLPRARVLVEQALASDLVKFGNDHPCVAARRSNLALLLSDLGDLPGAKLLLEQALASDLRSLGDDHPGLTARRANLARVLHDLGDLSRAKVLLEQALASDLQRLGDDHPTVAADRSSLAGVLKDLGDLPRAKVLLEQALASDLKNFGDEHPKVSTSRSNLALVLGDLGDLSRAKLLLEQALASDLAKLGDDHSSVAIVRSNLASVLKGLGDLAQAKLLLEQALASDLQSHGDGHPSVAIRRSNLAGVLQSLGDLPRAKLLLEQSLASALKTFGDDHPGVATRRSNLADVLQDLGDLEDAKVLLEQALTSDLKNFGDDHPAVATSRSNLALVFRDLGDLPRAKLLLEQALASALQSLGDDHPGVAISRSNLALVLEALGDLAGARREAATALAIVQLQPSGSRVRTGVERAVASLGQGVRRPEDVDA